MLRNAIAVCALKGGVGKTTTSVNLATGLAASGWKVLLVQADGTNDARRYFGINEEDTNYDGNLRSALSDVLDGYPAEPEPLSVGKHGLDFLPPGSKFSSATDRLASPNTNKALQHALQPIADKYNIIIIDTPPSNEWVQSVALEASQFFIAASGWNEAELGGVGGVLVKANEVVDSSNHPGLDFLGVVVIRFNRRKDTGRKFKNEFTERVTELGLDGLQFWYVRQSDVQGDLMEYNLSLWEYNEVSKKKEANKFERMKRREAATGARKKADGLVEDWQVIVNAVATHVASALTEGVEA